MRRTTLELAVSLLVAMLATAQSQSDWQVGRATFYGTDGWSIHQGSCGFYYIFEVLVTHARQIDFAVLPPAC